MTTMICPRRNTMATKCDSKTEVYSRVCGFFRPVQQWNKGKKEEFRERKEFVVAEGKRKE
jgi:ribonucleoside-triphosphate reductase